MELKLGHNRLQTLVGEDFASGRVQVIRNPNIGFRAMIALTLLTISQALAAHAQLSAAPGQVVPVLQGSSGANPSGSAGSITGTVFDPDGAVISNAKIVLTHGSQTKQSASGGDGSFSFPGVPSGVFQISFSAPGFANQTASGVVQPGETYVLPHVQLVVAIAVQVTVAETQQQIAEEQIHAEEKQRLFGVVPNFYVSYLPDAAPLHRKQKLERGWKTFIDPVGLGINGAIAGIEQADNAFKGYGQGAQGYAKRYGAAYADFASHTFFGSVIFPAILKQDPRYFYKGAGSRRSRFFMQ